MSGSGLAGAAIQGVKEVAELMKKYNDVPLYEKIVDLQSKVISLAGERLQLAEENTELKNELKIREEMIFRNPYYYCEGDEVPFCPKCFESSHGKLRMHLTHPPQDNLYNHGRDCRECKTRFREGPKHDQHSGRAVVSRGIADWS